MLLGTYLLSTACEIARLLWQLPPHFLGAKNVLYASCCVCGRSCVKAQLLDEPVTFLTVAGRPARYSALRSGG
jgi:hypothetical protein